MKKHKTLLTGGIFALLLTTSSFAAANQAPLTLQEVQKTTPVAMAEKSSYVMNSYNYLLKTAATISDETLRKAVINYLKSPVPSLLNLYQTDETKEALKQKLIVSGYISASLNYNDFLPTVQNPNSAPQPFYTAPGSGYYSHHSYPGGLATHTATNTKIALAIYDAYKDVYDVQMNRDVILASELMHDMNKPWVFQWQKDGASLPEASIAGQGAHHVLSIAEAMYRGFPKEVIVAMACAHVSPTNSQDEKSLIDLLNAAAIIAGKDPIAIGVLDADGNTLPRPRWMEGFITHLGDHDFVLTVPMAKWSIAKLEEIAKNEYSMSDEELKSAKFYTFRDYIFSQITIERLYHTWVTGGDQAMTAAVKAVVSK